MYYCTGYIHIHIHGAEFHDNILLLDGEITAKQKSLYEVRAIVVCSLVCVNLYIHVHVHVYVCICYPSCTCICTCVCVQFSEAPRQMRDKVDQLRGEIGDKTAWDSKYCSDLFNRRSE